MKINESCFVCVATYHHLVKIQSEQIDCRFYLCDPCGGIFFQYYASWGSLDTTNMRQIMQRGDCVMCPIKSEMETLGRIKHKRLSCKICQK